MKFEWDEEKRLKTLLERGLDFRDAQKAWIDSHSVELSIQFEDEARVIKISKFSDQKIYVVVFTYRDDFVRIISFRRASKKYEEIYEKE